MANERKRTLKTREQAESEKAVQALEEAMDCADMENIAKHVFLAKNKTCSTDQLSGGPILATVKYKGKTFTVITTVGENLVNSFKEDYLFDFA